MLWQSPAWTQSSPSPSTASADNFVGHGSDRFRYFPIGFDTYQKWLNERFVSHLHPQEVPFLHGRFISCASLRCVQIFFLPRRTLRVGGNRLLVPGSVFPVVTDSWTRVWRTVELPQHCFSASFMPHRHRMVYNFSPTDYVSDALWFAYPGPVFVAVKHFNVHHRS